MHHDEISLDPNEQAAHRYCLIILCQDVIAFMEALQVVPSFMAPWDT